MGRMYYDKDGNFTGYSWDPFYWLFHVLGSLLSWFWPLALLLALIITPILMLGVVVLVIRVWFLFFRRKEDAIKLKEHPDEIDIEDTWMGVSASWKFLAFLMPVVGIFDLIVFMVC